MVSGRGNRDRTTANTSRRKRFMHAIAAMAARTSARWRILPHDLLGILSHGAVRDVPPQEWAFLDTETTGLAGGTGTCAFLVGVGRITPEGFRVRQFFMRDYGEEASQLDALSRHLEPFRVLITYNGTHLRSAAARNALPPESRAPAVCAHGASGSAVRRAPPVEIALRELPAGGAGTAGAGRRARRATCRAR